MNFITLNGTMQKYHQFQLNVIHKSQNTVSIFHLYTALSELDKNENQWKQKDEKLYACIAPFIQEKHQVLHIKKT